MVNKNKESSIADKTSFTEPYLPRGMWQLCVDEASNQKGAGACVVIITLDGTLLEPKYEALFAALHFVKQLSIKKLAIYSDSQLITNQA